MGILGAGVVAETLHLPVLETMADVRVEWICDRLPERARRLARRHRVPRAAAELSECPDVDVVLVAIPVGHRRAAYEVIFARGWHALVEKPFAVSVEEHERILAEAATAGVQVGVGLMRRLYRSTQLCREIVEAGMLGEAREVWAAETGRLRGTGRGADWYQSDVRAAGGGVLMETGCHLVDQVFEAVGVTGFADVRAALTLVDGLDVEARVSARLETKARAGLPFTLTLSRTRDLWNGLAIECATGRIETGTTAEAGVSVARGAPARRYRLDDDARAARNAYQAFFLEWEAFLQQCRTGAASRVDAHSALLGTHFIEAAYVEGRAALPA